MSVRDSMGECVPSTWSSLSGVGGREARALERENVCLFSMTDALRSTPIVCLSPVCGQCVVMDVCSHNLEG